MIESEDCIGGPYTGNGVTTTFAYPFPVTNKSHLLVTKTVIATGVESDLVVDVDYTVNGVGSDDDADWDITTLGTPLASSVRIVITPNLPLTQLTDFANQGGFLPDTTEAAVDRGIVINQQLQAQIDRCVKVTVGSDTDPADLIDDLQSDAAAASASATAAASSASSASSSASSASTSESNAATSETNAAASAASAVSVGNGVLTTKGDTISFSSLAVRVPVGANDTVLFADSAATPGVAWKTIDLSTSRVTGVLPVAKFTTGTPTGSKFVRDDGVLAVPATGTTLPTGYTSTAQTLTAAGALTLAHGLGSAPRLVSARLKCQSADLNYSVNDEVIIAPAGTGASGDNFGVSIVPDATNLNIRFGSQTNIFVIVNKTTGGSSVIDLTKWKIIFDAWI